ncbi:hypothetical protein ABNQ39_11440 [Azospirillum sp. A26]|uniref:hypothetical protein n=1 Tax=Azospirillum sp. A26 TaxID=3160607 RepID=UPI00366DA6BB
MIDVAAVSRALRAPLAGGPIPADRIGLRGQPFTPPKGDTVHARVSITWERQGKTGPALWEGAGMLQILVQAPLGVEEEALLVEVAKVAALYGPHVDGAALDYGVRVVQVAVLGTVSLDGRGADTAASAAQWIAIPVQVDFRVERIEG